MTLRSSPVHHIVSVAVVDPGDDLLKEPAGVLKSWKSQDSFEEEKKADYLFLQFAVLYYVVKKLPARHILHNHKDIGGCGNDLKDEMCEMQKDIMCPRIKGSQKNMTHPQKCTK